jgi:hypothetical protein
VVARHAQSAATPWKGLRVRAFDSAMVSSMRSLWVTWLYTTVSSMSLTTAKRALSGGTSTRPMAFTDRSSISSSSTGCHPALTPGADSSTRK